MLYLRCTLLFLLGWLGLNSPLQAQQNVYISDVLYVPLRSGAGVEYRILNAAMRSGTKLTRLEQSDDGVWSRVTTEDGTEGWIRNQYLVEQMTSALKLRDALSRLERLERENERLKAQNSELNQNNSTLSSQASSETQTRQSLEQELEKIKQLSAGAIELDQRHQELLQKYELTQTERDSLLAENENMKNDQRLSFLLYGAGILFLGMVLAIILPVLKPKKRYSDWA